MEDTQDYEITREFLIIRDLAAGINDKSILMSAIRRHFEYLEYYNNQFKIND